MEEEERAYGKANVDVDTNANFACLASTPNRGVQQMEAVSWKIHEEGFWFWEEGLDILISGHDVGSWLPLHGLQVLIHQISQYLR